MEAERKSLDGKLIALLGEAAGEVRSLNPALAKRLMEMAAQVNAQGSKEKAVSAVK